MPEVDQVVGVFCREEIARIADRILGGLDEQQARSGLHSAGHLGKERIAFGQFVHHGEGEHEVHLVCEVGECKRVRRGETRLYAC